MSPPSKPDVAMQMRLKNFDEWYKGFQEHATSKSISMEGVKYDFPLTRGEICDEAHTEVFQNVDDPNHIVCCMKSVDMEKMGALMGSENFVKMSAEAIVQDPTPMLMVDPPPPGTPPPPGPAEPPTMLFWGEVADTDKWVKGFKAHGSSKTGTWGYEVPITRGEFCDEAKTVTFKSKKRANWCGGIMFNVMMEKLGPVLGDPAMQKVQGDLGEIPDTKVMKVLLPMPAPPQ